MEKVSDKRVPHIFRFTGSDPVWALINKHGNTAPSSTQLHVPEPTQPSNRWHTHPAISFTSAIIRLCSSIMHFLSVRLDTGGSVLWIWLWTSIHIYEWILINAGELYVQWKLTYNTTWFPRLKQYLIQVQFYGLKIKIMFTVKILLWKHITTHQKHIKLLKLTLQWQLKL